MNFPTSVRHRTEVGCWQRSITSRDFGEPVKNYDYLTDGIWEFKIGPLRVTFYDTPGDGTFSPKQGIRTESHWGRRYDFPEEFDEYVRVGHHFAKEAQRTPRKDIERAARVRQEDLSHDRN